MESLVTFTTVFHKFSISWKFAFFIGQKFENVINFPIAQNLRYVWMTFFIIIKKCHRLLLSHKHKFWNWAIIFDYISKPISWKTWFFLFFHDFWRFSWYWFWYIIKDNGPISKFIFCERTTKDGIPLPELKMSSMHRVLDF